MILIQQAIFGEGRDFGHALLSSSFADDKIPSQLSGFTDMTDRPRDRAIKQPIIRGFFAKDHFLLVKSFPDPSGREGRVFSHALIIEKWNLLRIKNISQLRKYFLEDLDKNAVMHPISYADTVITQATSVSDKELYATDGLIHHLDHRNTIVWSNENNYWEWLDKLWAQLPEKAKCLLQIGAVFNPSKINEELLNLVFLAEDNLQVWRKWPYYIVDEINAALDGSPVTEYLLGKVSSANPLSETLSKLELQVTEIDDLKVIGNYVNIYLNLATVKDLRDLLMLSGIISRYSPDKTLGKTAKRAVLDAIANCIIGLSSSDFLLLQHQSWEGFNEHDIENILGDKFKVWLDKFIFQKTSIEEYKIVATALGSKKRNWWHRFITDYIKMRLSKWKPEYSQALWNWIKIEINIAEEMFNLLPTDAEADLIHDIPDLDEAAFIGLEKLAKNKKWYCMYGLITLNRFASKEAFAIVLRDVDTGSRRSAFEIMSNNIGDVQFILDVSQLNDDMLIAIAVKKIINHPVLKQNLNIQNRGAQKIWSESLRQGVDVWEGILKPSKILFEIMDEVLADNDFNAPLLLAISKSKYSSLKDYKNRRDIWGILSHESKNHFISATLVDCICDYKNGKLKLVSLEEPLVDGLRSPLVIKDVFSDSTLPTKLKLEFFNSLVDSESYIEMLIQNSFFTHDEAIILGNIVSEKVWKKIAKFICNLAHHRKDIYPALEQCGHLLSFWDKLTLRSRGYNKVNISDDEIWDTILERAVENYPDGPNQNGLWENSGGKRSELHTSGSGKQIWTHALNHIRYGGKPEFKKIYAKMLEEFPYDNFLKNLKDII